MASVPQQYRPPLSEGQSLRIAFDNLYSLRNSIDALSLSLQKQTIQYKDWAGNNQSVDVVVGVTLVRG